MGCFLIIFPVFLPAIWHTIWHTAYDFGAYEIRKSRHVVGFLVLVICGWGSPKRSMSFGGSRQRFHCWE